MSTQGTDWQLEDLASWVMTQVKDWKDHIESNYYEEWERYNRLFRGQWDSKDKSRESERSKIVSPALQQAVESSCAEVEETTFGRGRFFDIKDDVMDQNPMDIVQIRENLMEDFAKVRIRTKVAECILNAAIIGTGIGEVVVTQKTERKPKTIDGVVGALSTDKVVVDMRPVHHRNFVIHPDATSVEDAMGVGIDEFVPIHQIVEGQESGIYRNEEISLSAPDRDLETDPSVTRGYEEERVRLTRYYGLVPRRLLEEEAELLEDDGDSEYVEACVVIANEDTILKAQENPYMLQDRPIIAFQWDIVPGRFWGRGVCEKGFNSQVALDAELRARIDALALTTAPMMGIDATRFRGKAPKVQPGRTVLTEGNPNEILAPMHFGNVDQITFAQASELQKMVQMATGAVDSAGIAGSINGEATASGISMSLGAIIKRHKRTLLGFQENFLIPMVQKFAYRYMQFDPERYPADDFKFQVTSTLGIMAREYEVTELVQLLQTTSPESPVYPIIIESIIDNMNLTDREKMIQRLRQAQQPTPEQQQAQQAQMQREQEMHQIQVDFVKAQTEEARARGKKYLIEAQLKPGDQEIDKVQAVTQHLDKAQGREDAAFKRRLDVVDRKLAEKKLDVDAAKSVPRTTS